MLRLINSMVTELPTIIQVVTQKLIKSELSSCRAMKLECNEENDETEGDSALYTPLLPLSTF